MVTSIGATANRSKELKKAASCRRRSPALDPSGAHAVLSPSPLNRWLLRMHLAQCHAPLHLFEKCLRTP